MTPYRCVSGSTRGKEGNSATGFARRIRRCTTCAEASGLVGMCLVHSASPCPGCVAAPFTGVIGLPAVVAVAVAAEVLT